MAKRTRVFLAILLAIGASHPSLARALVDQGSSNPRAPAFHDSRPSLEEEENLLGGRKVEDPSEGQIGRLSQYPGNGLYCDKRGAAGSAARDDRARRTHRGTVTVGIAD